MWSDVYLPHRHNTLSACTYDCAQIQTLTIVVPILIYKLMIQHIATSFVNLIFHDSITRKLEMSTSFFA